MTIRTATDPQADPSAAPLDLVVVGGAGHVGLPLSLAFVHAGLRVGVLDVAEDTLARVGAGHMPFMEPGAPELLDEALRSGRLELGSSGTMLSRADTVIVVIGTPVDEFLSPSMSALDEVIRDLVAHVREGALVVLRSTMFPGTTGRVAQAMRDAGRSVDVAVCPERIAEGHAVEELTTLPQIVGADDERAGDRAELLFRHLADRIVRTSTREAELAKLFTNTWRYMKFAVANQFFTIATDAGVDYARVLQAIRTDYPRAADLPGPGFAAGPCLFKDTMQLAAFTPDHFPMGHSAMLVNEGLPGWIVARMERRYGPLRGRRIGLLGVAFKAESDDTRSSLSYKLRKLLIREGATVDCTDPYARNPDLLPLEQVLETAEILVIGAPHRPYRDLDLAGREVVDVWGMHGTFRP